MRCSYKHQLRRCIVTNNKTRWDGYIYTNKYPLQQQKKSNPPCKWGCITPHSHYFRCRGYIVLHGEKRLIKEKSHKKSRLDDDHTLQWTYMSNHSLSERTSGSPHKISGNTELQIMSLTPRNLNYTNKKLLSSPTFSSFSKCSRRNFIGLSGLAMQRFTMHSLRICWMLCFCTKISQPFKLSSSSRVEEEEVAILSFISVAVGKKQGGPWEEGRESGVDEGVEQSGRGGDGRGKQKGGVQCKMWLVESRMENGGAMDLGKEVSEQFTLCCKCFLTWPVIPRRTVYDEGNRCKCMLPFLVEDERSFCRYLTS